MSPAIEGAGRPPEDRTDPALARTPPDLAALARAATPGPWTCYHLPRTNTTEVQAEGERPIVQWMGFDDSSRSRRQHGRNAAYIAAMSPDVTLALLDRLDHAKQRVRDLRLAASRYRAAEWAHRIHEDENVLTPEHNARVEEWRAADAALAELLAETSPFVREARAVIEEETT